MAILDEMEKIFNPGKWSSSGKLSNFDTTFGDVCKNVHNTLTSQNPVPTSQYFVSIEWIIVLLIISLLFLLILYIVNSYRKDPRKVAYVKVEIYELVMTGIIAFSILAIVYGFCSMPFLNIFPHSKMGKKSIYEVTKLYFNVSEDYVKKFNFAAYVIGANLDAESHIFPTAKPLGVGMQSKPFVGMFQPIKQLMYNAFIATTIFLITLYGFEYVVGIGAYISLNFFLPLGILLRAFTPTRRYGGALLGIAIGFLIVFPLILSISYEMLYGVATNGTKYGIISQSSILKSAGIFFAKRYNNGKNTFNLTKYEDVLYNLFKEKFKKIVNIMMASPTNVGKIVETIVAEGVSMVFSVLSLAINFLWEGILISVIMPVFSFYFFAELTRNIAGTLGEEVNIFGLTRLV